MAFDFKNVFMDECTNEITLANVLKSYRIPLVKWEL